MKTKTVSDTGQKEGTAVLNACNKSTCKILNKTSLMIVKYVAVLLSCASCAGTYTAVMTACAPLLLHINESNK